MEVGWRWVSAFGEVGKMDIGKEDDKLIITANPADRPEVYVNAYPF